jgi:hypothetical protein
MSVLRHAIAAMFSAGFLIAVAITVYVVGAAIGNDAGGPMVPFLIPLFAVIGGIATALLVYFPLSILFGWLSRKLRVSSWISPLVFLGLSFLFFTGWLVIVAGHFPSFSDVGLAALCGLFFTGGFTIYWLVLAAGHRMIKRHEDAG